MARVVKNLPANAGEVRDTGSILESGRPSGVGNGNPLQYSHQENPMEREAWLATVHRIPKSQTWLMWLSAHTHTHTHTHTQEVASEGNTQTTTLLSNNSQQTKALPSSACSFLIHLCSESQRASNFISDRNGCICYFYYILWFGVEKKWWTLYKKLMHMCVNLKKILYAVLSRWVVFNSLRSHGLQPARLGPWEFSMKEYWSGFLCPPPRDIPNTRM